MLLGEITKKIEAFCPLEYAYDWDNPGLLLGDKTQEIKKIMLSLDVTEAVLDEAVKKGADLIISHHPVIFSGIKSITSETQIGRILLKATKNNISLYAAHTNMDVAPKGINTVLADMLELENSVLIEENKNFENVGLGKVGDVKQTTLKDYAEFVKAKLNTPFVRISGNKKQIIKKVAIGSGSCAELIPEAIKMGADAIVTADLKYHNCLEFASDSFSIIDAGHYPTENMVKQIFAEILKGEDLIFSNQKDIFEVI